MNEEYDVIVLGTGLTVSWGRPGAGVGAAVGGRREGWVRGWLGKGRPGRGEKAGVVRGLGAGATGRRGGRDAGRWGGAEEPRWWEAPAKRRSGSPPTAAARPMPGHPSGPSPARTRACPWEVLPAHTASVIWRVRRELGRQRSEACRPRGLSLTGKEGPGCASSGQLGD